MNNASATSGNYVLTRVRSTPLVLGFTFRCFAVGANGSVVVAAGGEIPPVRRRQRADPREEGVGGLHEPQGEILVQRER